MGLRVCVSNRCPGDADAAGPPLEQHGASCHHPTRQPPLSILRSGLAPGPQCPIPIHDPPLPLD